MYVCVLLEHKSKGIIPSLIMIPRMPTLVVSGALLELAGTLNSAASFYGTEHLGILQGHSPAGRGDVSEVQRGVLPAVCMSVCRQYLLVTSPQMLKRCG